MKQSSDMITLEHELRVSLKKFKLSEQDNIDRISILERYPVYYTVHFRELVEYESRLRLF